MSRRAIDEASKGLDAVLQVVFKLEDEQAWQLSEAFKVLAEAVADQEIDRLFNRGDFRS